MCPGHAMPTSMYNGQQAPPNGCPGKPANPIKIHSSTFSALDVTGADDATTAAAAAADVVIKCKHSAGHGDRTITKTQDSLDPSVRPSRYTNSAASNSQNPKQCGGAQSCLSGHLRTFVYADACVCFYNIDTAFTNLANPPLRTGRRQN